MSNKLQMILIGLLMVALLVVAIAFWGSIASVLCIFLLLVIPVEVIISRVLINRDDHDYNDYS